MTIKELIAELENIEELHGDLEIRLATQPNWPFEHEIDSVSVADINKEDDEDEEENPERDVEMIAYIGEGSQLGYLPGGAKNALGW